MPLSDAKVRNAKPKDKPYKISDGEGMFLLVHPTGSKYWRLKYHFGGKERLLALGVYPEVSLSDARDRRAQARKALAGGHDPGAAKREVKRLAVAKAENSFEAVAREWYDQRRHTWADNTAKLVNDRLEKYLLPKLGDKPVLDITAPDVLSAVRVVESKGALDTARRVMQICGQVFMYAIATGKAVRNPVPDLRGALKTPVTKHHSYLKAAELPEFLRKLGEYDGAPQTELALKLLMLTFVRTTELRAAEWAEVDLRKGEWRIPAKRMKMKEEHLVPLSRQAIKVLKELQKLTGSRQFLFPNQHHPRSFMSENTMLYALYRMGYHSRTTGHGFCRDRTVVSYRDDMNGTRFSVRL